MEKNPYLNSASTVNFGLRCRNTFCRKPNHKKGRVNAGSRLQGKNKDILDLFPEELKVSFECFA